MWVDTKQQQVTWMQVLPAKRQEEKFIGRYSRENKGIKMENMFQVLVNQTSLKQKSYSLYNEQPELHFLLKVQLT